MGGVCKSDAGSRVFRQIVPEYLRAIRHAATTSGVEPIDRLLVRLMAIHNPSGLSASEVTLRPFGRRRFPFPPGSAQAMR
jgi:hypothetical protein